MKNLFTDEYIKDLSVRISHHSNAILGANFETASVDATPNLLYQWIKNTEYRLNNTNDDLEKLKIILDSHIDFERIHPYSDGNGRTGRLLMLYYSLKIDLPFVIQKENRNIYMEYLRNRDIDKILPLIQNLIAYEKDRMESV